MKSVSLIIVNWNTGELLRNCIQSIEESATDAIHISEIVIVDNNSGDNSIELIEQMKTSKSKIKIVRNKSNEGFSKACNKGAKLSNGDYLLFLNPDTILYKNTLDSCFNFLSKTKIQNIGAMGIQLIDENGQVQRTCSRLPRKRYYIVKCLGISFLVKKLNAFMLEWDHKESRKVEEVIGAFFIVPSYIFREMKGFDERFFVYYEEVDFCKRLAEKGYCVYYYAGAKAYHMAGGSSGQVKDYRLFYELRSRVQYQQKHYGSFNARIVTGLIYMEYVSRYVLLLIKQRKTEIDQLKKAYRMFIGWEKEFQYK